MFFVTHFIILQVFRVKFNQDLHFQEKKILLSATEFEFTSKMIGSSPIGWKQIIYNKLTSSCKHQEKRYFRDTFPTELGRNHMPLFTFFVITAAEARFSSACLPNMLNWSPYGFSFNLNPAFKLFSIQSCLWRFKTLKSLTKCA